MCGFMYTVIEDWSAEHKARFQNAVMTFQHNLDRLEIFSDAALADLLDNHPNVLVDVCTMKQPDHSKFPNKFRTGDFRDVPGAVMIEAAKSGAIWINIREAMCIHAEYKAVLDQMYGDLIKATGFKPLKIKGGILISSPIAKVPYHFDKTETILWHIRGKKRIYIYPQTEKFIPDIAYEKSIVEFLDDDLPYKSDFDDEAKIIDLHTGQAATWPLNSPHRVDNQSYCVSVTTEYSTLESVSKNSAMLTNAALRYRFGVDASYRNDGVIQRHIKSAFGRVLEKAGAVPKRSVDDVVTFKLDPSVDGYLRNVEPYKREF